LLRLPDLDFCCGCGGTMEKEDCTQLETEEETSCTAAKKQIKKKNGMTIQGNGLRGGNS
jgi:hypothetical protein